MDGLLGEWTQKLNEGRGSVLGKLEMIQKANATRLSTEGANMKNVLVEKHDRIVTKGREESEVLEGALVKLVEEGVKSLDSSLASVVRMVNDDVSSKAQSVGKLFDGLAKELSTASEQNEELLQAKVCWVRIR